MKNVLVQVNSSLKLQVMVEYPQLVVGPFRPIKKPSFLVTTQPKGATKLGRKGLPMKARRKAWRAICPFLRAVER
jgi:hypothetical protein